MIEEVDMKKILAIIMIFVSLKITSGKNRNDNFQKITVARFLLEASDNSWYQLKALYQLASTILKNMF